MRHQRQRKNGRSRPADEQRNRTSQQRANPAEVSLDAAMTLQLGDALRR